MLATEFTPANRYMYLQHIMIYVLIDVIMSAFRCGFSLCPLACGGACSFTCVLVILVTHL